MSNKENLKPIRSKNEARERGKKGGIKSGEVRRERKQLKEELLLLLAQGKTQEKISIALIEKAKTGDVRAFETIRDTIGEKPTEKQEILTNEKYLQEKIYIFPKEFKNPEELYKKIQNAKNTQLIFVSKEEAKEIDDHINNFIGL